jgi:molecular chaperone GrpE
MSETDNNPAAEADAVDAEVETEAAEAAPEGKTVEQLEAELDDLRDRLLRAVAEEQNTRRRAEKEKADTRAYAVTGFARDMLDVADNLSRAVAAVDEASLAEASQPLKNLVEGVAMTERALLSKMENHGIKQVAPEPGSAFDPNLHQAVAQIPSDQPAGTIAAVMQTGFVISSRTLRAAMVAVSAGAPAGGETPAGETGGNVDLKA